MKDHELRIIIVAFVLFVVALCIISYKAKNDAENSEEPKMQTYYITFSSGTLPSGSIIKSWVIRCTKNNLNEANGLNREIKALTKEYGYDIVINYWKKIDGFIKKEEKQWEKN